MSLFPPIEPYATGLLDVSDGHTLFWERSGTPDKPAVLFLHGGPGSGSSPRHRRYYDPGEWDIIQFDQRGCGRSLPRFELQANTTHHLIDDIEVLRHHLGLDRWTVFGPSWGSTLALAYATAHPDRVESLVLEGVFLGTREEIDWWHSPRGAGAVYPDAFHQLMQTVPYELQSRPKVFIAWALDQMLAELRDGAPALTELDQDNPDISRLRQSLIYRWSEYEETLSWMSISPSEIVQTFKDKGRDWVISHSLIEAHYFANDCFLDPPLLDRVSELSMPVHILQSQYDMVCPMQAAQRLHRTLPHSSFHMIAQSGHAMTDTAFAQITRHFAALSDSR